MEEESYSDGLRRAVPSLSGEQIDAIVAFNSETLFGLMLRGLESDVGALKAMPSLTGRQRQILDLLTHGYMHEEMAEKADCSVATIKNEVQVLFKAFSARNAAHLVGNYMRR
jgi:DNA-binding NarL/FixJ family response regulator